MAKNQLGYVVNVSSSDFKNLLEAQVSTLGELTSIKKLMELSQHHEKTKQVSTGNQDLSGLQEKILDTLEDQLKTTKRRAKQQEDYEREWRVEAANIADLAQTMKTQGNVFQEMGASLSAKKQGIQEKLSLKTGGLGRTVMGALNVGGVFNKAIAKSEFREKQRLIGGDTSNANAEGAYQTAKQIKAHEQEIGKFKRATGMSEEQMATTKGGAALLSKRNELTDKYGSHDVATNQFSPTPVMPLNAGEAQESQMEAAKVQEKELKLLEEIRDGLGGKTGGVEKVKPEKASGGGLMDTITGFLGEGFMTAIKTMFSPMNILKALGKIFAIGMIVGSLFEGITDGFDEYMKTGSIGKALIAGLAGIVDFLTFGLFDKDAIKEVIGDFSSWIGEHVVTPFMEFLTSAKDGLMSALSAIGIPKIKLFDSKLTGEVSVGPFYPFKSEGGSKSPEAPAPTSASTVEQKSADNAGASLPEKQSGGSNIVNAPVNNNTTQNQIIRAPIRNQDSSVNRYADSRLRQA
jgi:hypothetical protein